MTPVSAELLFLVDTGVRPVTLITEAGDGASECSGTYRSHRVPICDARRLEPEPTLDREGFALRIHTTRVADLYDDAEVVARYYPEMECLVREATGASRVVVFDHNTRAEGEARARHANARGPVNLVHNDFTGWSGPARVRRVLPEEEAENLLKGRLAMVNAWRPIRGPLESKPLALCDAQSIGPGDLIAADMVYRERRGEEYRSVFNPSHRWCFYPRLEPHEVILIKVCDTATDGPAKCSLHSAFDDPGTPVGAAPRESIEVRAMAFW